MLVILPGWMHDAAQWNAVSKLLDNLQVEHVVVDFPGFGTVPSEESITSFEKLVLWTQVKIDAIKIQTNEPITILGHSCGGRIAAALAAQNSKYKQLILVGSPNLYRPTLKVQAIKLLAKFAAPIKALIPMKVRLALRSDDYTRATKSGMNHLYRSVVVDDQTELIKQVSTYVELLWGAHDTAAPVRIATELDLLLPNSNLTILPNLGHNLHHENPGLLAAKIKMYVQPS